MVVPTSLHSVSVARSGERKKFCSALFEVLEPSTLDRKPETGAPALMTVASLRRISVSEYASGPSIVETAASHVATGAGEETGWKNCLGVSRPSTTLSDGPEQSAAVSGG
jgi:hypothetical protein